MGKMKAEELAGQEAVESEVQESQAADEAAIEAVGPAEPEAQEDQAEKGEAPMVSGSDEAATGLEETPVSDEASEDEPAPEAAEEQADTAYSYDQVPYVENAFLQTHPDRAATLGRLFGLSPKPVDACRILELGCGLGSNLIPMAEQLPGSEMVGLDLSRLQVEAGRELIQSLGLTNIRLEHADIGDVDDSWGKFDYIICHGVFSWVPAEIRDKILDICRQNLEPQGIAYISYNTYPGWHMREMIRHMMRYHSRQFEQPQARISQSKALLRFVAKSLGTSDQPYAVYLRQELAGLERVAESYLFHEHLEEVNVPLYFHQFMEQAASHGLKYLGESDVGSMLMYGSVKPEVRRTVARIGGDEIRTEQYMDFLRNRGFRQTLLCHDEVSIDRSTAIKAVEDLLVWATARPARGPVDFNPQKVTPFRSLSGASIKVRRPITKAALQVLAERHPRTIGFRELFEAALDRVPERWRFGDAAAVRAALAQDVLECYTLGGLELRTTQPELTPEVSERPRMSPLAAHQARAGKEMVVNRYHRQIKIGPLARKLAPLLDGEHDRAALVEHAKSLVRSGDLPMVRNGRPVTDPDAAQDALEDAVGQALGNLAAASLLIA